MIGYLLLFYVVFSIIFYGNIYNRNNARRAKIIRKVEGDISNMDVTVDLLDTIKKIEEIKKIDSPWYEKLISVIGATAFFGMSLATTLQAYDAYKKDEQLNDAQKRIERMAKDEKQIKQYMKISAEHIMNRYIETFELDKSERQIVGWRAEGMLKEKNIDNKSLRKMFSILIAIKKYDMAARVIEKNMEIFDSADIYDKVTLAEYYHLKDDRIMFRNTINTVDEMYVSPKIAVRFYSLLWVANQKNEQYVRKLSKIIHKSERETSNRMKQYIASFDRAH